MAIVKLQEGIVQLQKEIGSFQGLLDSAIDESEVPLKVLLHSTASDIWELKVNLDDIALTVAQEKKNVKRKFEIYQITGDFFQMASEIEAKVEEVGVIGDGKDSTLEDLDEAYKTLKVIEKEDLPRLQAQYSKLPLTEIGDGIKSKAVEQQTKVIKNLESVQSLLLNKIEANNSFNALIVLFKEKASTVSRELESAQLDVNRIISIKDNDLLAVSKVIADMKEVVQKVNISRSDLIQECDEEYRKITNAVDLKCADAERNVIDVVGKRLDVPLEDLDFDNVERDIDALPHQSLAYVDLKSKLNGIKRKLELQKKTKEELEIIANALKEINTSSKDVLPINEYILLLKKKLNDLTECLKPKSDSLILTGDADIDKDLKKQRRKVNKSIEKIKKELENKEFEKTVTVYKAGDGVKELLLKSEREVVDSDLLRSKEMFSTLRSEILNKLNELNTLNKNLIGDNLKKIIGNNIKIVNQALHNTDTVLSNIEKREKEINKLQGMLKKIESSADYGLDNANELIERYANSPQPFGGAKADVEKINSIILETNRFIKVASKIADDLKDNNFEDSLFIQKLNNYSNAVKNLEELKLKIEDDIKREDNLIRMRNQLQITLNKIIEKASIIFNITSSL
uniref:GAR domain-containing protein n=1 Tax=Strongyloides stercoralis TaxID=6248 RepID=A0A0K0ES38_STRER